MATEIEICTKALYLIGDQAITSFDDGTKRSNLCKALYYDVVDAVLRAYPWNCARFRDKLQRLTTTPQTGGDYDWAYEFSLPAKPHCLWVPKQLNQDIDYKIENRKLLCDDADVTIVYIGRPEAPGYFDSLLTEAITARMAAELSYPITGDKNLAKTMWELYGAKLREARTMDGMEGDIEPHTADSLIDVR